MASSSRACPPQAEFWCSRLARRPNVSLIWQATQIAEPARTLDRKCEDARCPDRTTERTHSGRDLECGRAMIPKMRFGWARLPMLVAGVSLASMLAAAAQTPPADDDTDTPAAEETEAAPERQRRRHHEGHRRQQARLEPAQCRCVDPDRSGAEGKRRVERRQPARIPRGPPMRGRTAPPRCRSSNPSRRSGIRASAPT